MTGFAFLDESEDTGLKIGRGSSERFVVAIVLVDDPLPLRAAIDNLRTELGFPRLAEFKFYKSQPAIRLRFLHIVAAHQATILGFVVNKLPLVGLPKSHQFGDFYAAATRLALIHHRETFDRTPLAMDRRSTSRTAQRTINAALRQAVNSDPQRPALRGITHVPSLGNNLIRVADMVAGAIYASVGDQNDQYLDIIRVRVRSIAHRDEHVDEVGTMWAALRYPGACPGTRAIPVTIRAGPSSRHYTMSIWIHLDARRYVDRNGDRATTVP